MIQSNMLKIGLPKNIQSVIGSVGPRVCLGKRLSAIEF